LLVDLKMQNGQTMEKAIAVFGELKVKAHETKDKAKDRAVIVLSDIKAKSMQTKDHAEVILRNPDFQKCSVATAGGTIAFGAVGGAFGLASGVVIGGAAGVVPALFTLGLSIPAGAVAGGICGLCTGTLVGGTSGGITGFTVYKYRIEIKDGAMVVKVKMHSGLDVTKATAGKAYATTTKAVSVRVYKAQAALTDIASRAKKNSLAALAYSRSKTCNAYEFATTTKVGVTSTSAVAGAMVGGTTTGAVGCIAGAAVGLVPALFTFGLSIPAGAMVGLCAGSTVGGSVGAVSGGAIGYTGFTHGKAIREGIQSTVNKASAKAEELKNKTFNHAAKATESVKAKLRAGTGGSAKDD
jgi:hypothetical protein